MNFCDDTEFWLERLAAAKARLLVLDTAIITVAGGAQMYSLDSGQTRHSVTRSTIGQLEAARLSAENQVATLNQRLFGCGTTVVQPGW